MDTKPITILMKTCIIKSVFAFMIIWAPIGGFSKGRTNEMLIYCVNTPFIEKGGGFRFMKKNSKSEDFGGVNINHFIQLDWTCPVNYAEGKMHIYIRIKNQPVPQGMVTCWNAYQSKEGAKEGEDLYWYEIGSKREYIKGEPGNVYTWEYNVSDLGEWDDDHDFWVKKRRTNGQRKPAPIDWTKPRYRQSVRFWTSDGEKEVHRGRNWGGEDPDKWWPLDFTYLVVIVEKGGTFSGWDNYIDQNGILKIDR